MTKAGLRRLSRAETLRKFPPTPGHIARFWAKVAPPNDLGCREFSGAKNEKGYGIVGLYPNTTIHAHRLSYFLSYGTLPESAVICHRCDNPACCEPTHLFSGTKADNNADMRGKGRHSHGVSHYAAKLSPQKVRSIRKMIGNGATIRQCAQRYCVSHGTIEDVIYGKTWKEVK